MKNEFLEKLGVIVKSKTNENEKRENKKEIKKEVFKEKVFRRVVEDVKGDELQKKMLVLKIAYNEKEFVKSVRVAEDRYVILVSSNDIGSDTATYEEKIFENWK